MRSKLKLIGFTKTNFTLLVLVLLSFHVMAQETPVHSAMGWRGGYLFGFQDVTHEVDSRSVFLGGTFSVYYQMEVNWFTARIEGSVLTKGGATRTWLGYYRIDSTYAKGLFKDSHSTGTADVALLFGGNINRLGLLAGAVYSYNFGYGRQGTLIKLEEYYGGDTLDLHGDSRGLKTGEIKEHDIALAFQASYDVWRRPKWTLNVAIRYSIGLMNYIKEPGEINHSGGWNLRSEAYQQNLQLTFGMRFYTKPRYTEVNIRQKRQ